MQRAEALARARLRVGRVRTVQMYIPSADEIRKASAFEVVNAAHAGAGSVVDPRSGAIHAGEVCATDMLDHVQCPGHSGHMELAIPVIHPLQKPAVIELARSVCHGCSKPRALYTIHEKPREFVQRCMRARVCAHCNLATPLLEIEGATDFMYFRNSATDEIVTPAELHEIFGKVSAEDQTALGYNPRWTHVRDLVITVLQIMSRTARLPILSRGITRDDDLTTLYRQIAASNIALRKITEEQSDDKGKFQSHLVQLATRIATLFDSKSSMDALTKRLAGKKGNSGPKRAAVTTNAQRKQMRSIQDRLQTKAGMFVKNMLGKRGDFNARTVLSTCPWIPIGWVCAPAGWARELTRCIKVCDYNKGQLYEWLISEKVRTVTPCDGDMEGVELSVEQYRRLHPNRFLEVGDVVERFGMNGDVWTSMRPPALHKFNTMGFRVIFWKHKTVGKNPSQFAPFNADVDGDEMQLTDPQSWLAVAEVSELMDVRLNMLNPGNNMPMIGVEKDAVIALRMMTHPDCWMERGMFCDAIMQMSVPHVDPTSGNVEFRYPDIDLGGLAKQHPEMFRNGGFEVRASLAITATVPRDFCYNEKGVVVQNGVLTEGQISSEHVGRAPRSIGHMLGLVYGPLVQANFVSAVSAAARYFLTHHTFTFGIADCISRDDEIPRRIAETVNACCDECTVPADSAEKEAEIALRLRGVGEEVQQILKEDVARSNPNMQAIVGARIKVGMHHASQIRGLAGQQFLGESRLPRKLSGRKRATVSHAVDDYRPSSQGFCNTTFFEGLDGTELFYGALTARPDIVRKQMETSDAGMVLKQLTEATKDAVTATDGSVRTVHNEIIQFAYGGCDRQAALREHVCMEVLGDGKRRAVLYNSGELRPHGMRWIDEY